MKNKRLLFIFLLFCNFLQTHTYAQKNDIDVYYHYNLSLDFKEAQNIANSFKELQVSKQAIALSQVLYKAGQLPHEPLPLLEQENQQYTSEAFILNRLQQGYYCLFYNKKNIANALQLFIEAYALAVESEDKTLQKLCLLAILEFYHFEFQITNQNFSIYLNNFKKLAKNKNEQAWASIHSYHFAVQNSIEDLNKIQNYANEIITFEADFNQEENLYWLLLSLKSYFDETNLNDKEAISGHKRVVLNTKNIPFLNYLTFRSYYRLCLISIEKNEFDNAENYLIESKKYIDKSDILRGEVYVYYLQADLFSKKKDYQKAYQAIYTYDSLRNKLNLQENTIINSIVETELRTEQKEKQLLLEKQKNRQNKNLILSLSIGFVALTLSSLLFYINIKRKHKIANQEKVIALQAKEKLLKESEINTINAMIEGQEKERARLASELHDNVGGSLIAAKFQLDFLSTQKKNNQLNTQYQKIQELLSTTYNEVRKLSHLKNSGVLPKDGLVPAVFDLANNASTQELKITVSHFGLHKRINNKIEIALFRMIQELVTNIIKHANATEAEISLTQRESVLSVFVEDNGIGFINNRSSSKKNGMGLSSIEKKTHYLNGQFEIDSTIGKGTHISLEIPLDHVE